MRLEQLCNRLDSRAYACYRQKYPARSSFEMRHEKPALAAGVAINEAVEIAKLMEPKNLRALLTVF